MLDTKVMSDDTIHAGTSIIKVVIGQHNEHGISAFLSFDKYRIATKQLERLHGVVRQGNDGVVIVDGVGDTSPPVSLSPHPDAELLEASHIKAFGFFFFLRMAVAVSST